MAVYWHLVRELLYSGTHSTKSTWELGSRIEKFLSNQQILTQDLKGVVILFPLRMTVPLREVVPHLLDAASLQQNLYI